MLDKFAEELKEAREKSGITLQQIAQKSRIDLKYIQAIDQGDFNFLPELYVKAFIKQFAKIVGLDEQATIKKYEAARAGRIPVDEPEPEPENPATAPDDSDAKKTEIKKSAQPEISKPVKAFQENQESKSGDAPPPLSERLKSDKAMIAGITGGILAVIFALVYFFFIRTGSDIIVAEKPYDEIRKESQQRYVPDEKPQKTDNTGMVASADSLTVGIYASDTTWIRLKVDGRSAQEFKLYPNTSRSFRAAANVSMIVGNAGATKLKLGDRELNFTGKKNEVRYVSIDKNGLKYINTPPTF